MRRFLVLAALSASLAACHDDEAAELQDAGDQAATHEDASDARDAGESESEDDGGEQSDGGAGSNGGGSDAGGAMDAGRGRDAGQDAGGGRDAGSSTTSPEGGASAAGCAGKSYKLCEDFESANVAALPSGWTTVSAWGGGTAVVASDEFHSGTKSLKGASAVNGQTRIGKSLSALGATANKHWGRVFFKVKSPATLPPSLDTPPNSVLHNTFVSLKASNEWRVVDTTLNTQGKNAFLLNIPDDSCCGETQYTYSAYDGKWHCAEWYFDVAMQEFRFFFDKTEASLLGVKPEGVQGQQVTQLIVGFIGYQVSKTPYNQAWFDDVALDDNRIGCD
jgi:hypothetical protein